MEPVKITVSSNNVISIKGDVSTIEDYARIRDSINELIGNGAIDIVVDFEDSKTIMSSLLGFFMKLINHDKVKVRIRVGSNELYKSLKTMHLIDLFDIRMR
ncbi:MAG: hypothetical protein N3C60_02010 [Calditerrivibrio sp.]|nr:hypothetical protein [Calditerrivibrio sp.]